MDLDNRLIGIHQKIENWRPKRIEDIEFKAKLKREVFMLICDIIEEDYKQ